MAAQTLPDLECACATIRRAARLVTQLYSQEMGQTIEPGQFAMLTALSRNPGATQAPIGRALGLDKTTLSRNLRVLETNGWIELTLTDDRRTRGYRVTRTGGKMIGATQKAWTQAQTRLQEALPSGKWKKMFESLAAVSNAAITAQRNVTKKGSSA
jgi:DNA-binding MarR family transcriptional regulator